MPDLSFQIENAHPQRFAATPTLIFRLRIANANAEEAVHCIALRVQIQLEVARRHYTSEEQQNLRELFGEPHRWGETLKSMVWTYAGLVVPAFAGSTSVDLPVPCTFDFNIATTKYFHGLADADIPLSFLFSGTVMYGNESRAIQVAPIPWDKEARFRLPLKTWTELMNIHYPNSAWLCLRRDVFERLHRYKVDRGLATWEQAMESMLPEEVLKT